MKKLLKNAMYVMCVLIVAVAATSCQKENSKVKPTAITLDQTAVSLEVGATATIKATATPAEASLEGITYTSSDNAVATVTNAGVITGVAAGSANITVAVGDVKAVCAVTVNAALTGMHFTEATIITGFGDAFQTGNDVVVLSMTTEGGAELVEAYLFVPTGTTDFAGTYNVSASQAESGPYSFSPGGVSQDGQPIPTLYAHNLQNEQYHGIALINEGTITINANKNIIVNIAGIEATVEDGPRVEVVGYATTYTVESNSGAPAKAPHRLF